MKQLQTTRHRQRALSDLPDPTFLRLARVFEEQKRVPLDQPEGRCDGPGGTASLAYFQWRMGDDIGESSRSNQPLCCLVVQVNGSDPDVTGLEPIHATRLIGDFARLLVKVCNHDQLICNCSPGRFAILLPHTARGAAVRLADRLLTLIRGRAWRIADCHADLLCSVGVSQRESSNDDDLLGRALRAAGRAAGTGQLVSIAA
jgi:PleD family two-component response regulator